jgi:hypothetical protein
VGEWNGNALVIPPCEDAQWELVDGGGGVLDVGVIPSGGSAIIVAPDAGYTLEDTLGGVLGSGPILSGGSLVIIAPNGSVPVTNTANTPITTLAVPSGNPVPYQIPDTPYTLKNSANQSQGSGSLVSITGGDVPIANVAWTDSDGSAESTPYGDSITCTPQVQSLTIRFAIKVTHDAFSEVMTANEAGSITAVNAGGLSAFVLSKNASPVTAPFTIANGDVISATFTAAGSATTVKLTGTY